MNDIHPTAQIGPHVRLGVGNVVGPFVVITGEVTIGDGNWVGAGAVLGAPPEIRSFPHPRDPDDSFGSGVMIGSHTVIREYVQIHGGWKEPTRVGDGVFLMNQTYVGHDGQLGDGSTLASSVLLGGHVTIGAGANLGLGATVHQFRRVGVGAMVGMGAVVTRDVPSFALVYGSPAKVRGANRVGLERRGVDASTVARVHDAYLAGQELSLIDIERLSAAGIAS